jgi:hypothetical protein
MKQYLTQLIQATQLLAADYETQHNQLPDFVHLPDELALIYEDAILLLDQIIQAELITLEQAMLFREIDNRWIEGLKGVFYNDRSNDN